MVVQHSALSTPNLLVHYWHPWPEDPLLNRWVELVHP